MISIRLAVTGLATCVALWGDAAVAGSLPTLDDLMADFAFSKEDVQRVRNGELVKTTTKETSEREIAAIMVFLVRRPAQDLVSFIEAGKGFRNDPQVQSATEIPGEGRLDDFEPIVLQPDGQEETRRYLDAAAGDTLNLSKSEIAAFQALKNRGAVGQAEVERELRRMLLARFRAYRTKGLAGIAPYARAKAKQAQPGEELRRATEAAKGLAQHTPAFYDLLLDYPRGNTEAGLTERYFCIRYAMGGRPNFTLRHRLALPVDDGYVVADREFYVSHDYNETQAIAALLPVENGTVVAYINRTTTDQLGGFGASAKQAVGRRLMAEQISEIFETSRADFGGR